MGRGGTVGAVGVWAACPGGRPATATAAARRTWSAIICGETYAPTVIGAVSDPGDPSDDSAGPSLPAEVKTAMFHLRTAALNVSLVRP